MTGKPRRGEALSRMLEQGQAADAATQQVLPAPTPPPASPPTAPAAVPAVAAPAPTVSAEARVHFGSRMRPSLQTLIHQTSVDLRGQLGRRVLLERVLEAIMEEYRDDPDLRARVARRVGEE
ncbi:hypothetical protein GCM10008959_26100 [Deinococcus seoulensis]|uniref:ATPase n=1 Tax=Deinococcus seoulensis TaxID=1837379 RepID=A0ABQ2RUI0_9DEIO|nr:hypothetical protein [Deinococcus seoulensis]GGR62830.1 hypothetical protein GCM10008959_26100 [Deinococcus seoulensis]